MSTVPVKSCDQRQRSQARKCPVEQILIPVGTNESLITQGQREIKLTNLQKTFWKAPLITKGDLLQYYSDVSPYLLPHLVDRAMVMKRYPNGIDGDFFFMKRVPEPHPSWLKLCSIAHASGSIINFPVIQDLLSLLWVVNLGCIDLNPWYARCDDVNRPDYLHFDLDPVPGANFGKVRKAAQVLHDALDQLGMRNLAKTSGSRGIHIYVPIVRGPTQKQVWTFAKTLALAISAKYPRLLTSEYRIAKRAPGRVLVDYNQKMRGEERLPVSIPSALRPKRPFLCP